MKIEDQVRKLIEKVIEENNYKLDEILYIKEGNLYNLTVVIDKDGEIAVEDCITVSKLINPLLDEANLINNSYILDVCSKEKGCDHDE